MNDRLRAGADRALDARLSGPAIVVRDVAEAAHALDQMGLPLAVTPAFTTDRGITSATTVAGYLLAVKTALEQSPIGQALVGVPDTDSRCPACGSFLPRVKLSVWAAGLDHAEPCDDPWHTTGPEPVTAALLTRLAQFAGRRAAHVTIVFAGGQWSVALTWEDSEAGAGATGAAGEASSLTQTLREALDEAGA